MKWSTLLPLALSTLSLLPSTGAWQITWTDSDNQQHSQSGTGPSDCIVIDNPKGHIFKIDSQGEKGINMLLFANNKCSGGAAGMATDVFSRESSQDLLGFKVVAQSSTTTTASATTGRSVSRVATTFPSTSPSGTASRSISDSGESMTIQPTDAMSTTATTTATTTSTSTSEKSSTASSTTSSAASKATPNAAGQLAVSNGDMVKGLVGTIFGLGTTVLFSGLPPYHQYNTKLLTGLSKSTSQSITIAKDTNKGRNGTLIVLRTILRLCILFMMACGIQQMTVKTPPPVVRAMSREQKNYMRELRRRNLDPLRFL
ncbi:hypothetical protein CNMCM7691_008784 [Aspergillus felis]|uniref:Uncharacterized protein n=1 Tax=Aspergillus felis TaxID=1287682 RepID=A0A8H6QVX2_9EURO|nr:hypothetical protein CNMCM7691_008784 [Aspergillus felis]